MRNNLASWAKRQNILIHEVAQKIEFSRSTVYKVSSGESRASVGLRLAFLKNYGPENYVEVFGRPEKTDEVIIYMEVVNEQL